MTATSSTLPSRIDASCRLPVFTLLGGAALWLVLSSVFGMAASMTFHKSSIFADSAIFTYGRAYPAWSVLLIYGFAIPSGLAVGLWLLCRLGQVPLANPFVVAVGAKLWHLGVLVALVAVLNGQGTGYEWFEIPRYAAVILFLGFLLIALRTFTTYSRRNAETLYPSQWFVLGALFLFPWILTTAILLLQVFPVRGVVQAAISWWYAGNLLNVWLSLAGLAATFYLLPKLTGRALQTHYLALFVFWTVLFFGTWSGIPSHSPLPAWMSALSGVATVMMVIPAIAIAAIVIQTTSGAKVACSGGPLCFSKFAAWAFLLSTLAAAIAACPAVSRVTDFTWFTQGNAALRIYGFFAMTMFAAIYHLLPRVAGIELSAAKIKAHFWLAMPGSLLVALPLLISGVQQGLKLSKAEVGFLEATQAGIMFFRLSSIGELLLAVGALVFLLNVFSVMVSYYRSVLKTAYADATALQTVEVKS